MPKQASNLGILGVSRRGGMFKNQECQPNEHVWEGSTTYTTACLKCGLSLNASIIREKRKQVQQILPDSRSMTGEERASVDEFFAKQFKQ